MKTKNICTASRNKSPLISSKIGNPVRRFGVKALLAGTTAVAAIGTTKSLAETYYVYSGEHVDMT